MRRGTLLTAGVVCLATACGPASGPVVRTTPRPQRLTGTAIAYDATTDEVVAFGGQTRRGRAIGPSRATWRWTGERWLRRPSRTAPPARSHALMTTDPATGGALLFGGRVERWITPLCAPSPPGRGQPVCRGTVSPVRVLDDTWELAARGWSRRLVAADQPQQGRLLAGDPAIGRVVLVGRSAAMSTSGVDGTWMWQGRRWAPLSPTTPEAATTMAFDPVTRRLLAYGGQAPFTPAAGMGAPPVPGYARTWVLGRHGWVELRTATSPARSSGVLAADADGSALLLIESNGQTWTWTGSDWRLRPTVGHPRGEVLAAATDRTRREVVLLVGSTAGEVTWTLREDRWTSHGRAP